MLVPRFVFRLQTKELRLGPMKIFYVKTKVTFHLRLLSLDFNDGTICEYTTEITNETLFVVKWNIETISGSIGDQYINFVDLVYRVESVSITVQCGGDESATIYFLLIAFQKVSKFHCVYGMRDSALGVYYRSSRRMDGPCCLERAVARIARDLLKVR